MVGGGMLDTTGSRGFIGGMTWHLMVFIGQGRLNLGRGNKQRHSFDHVGGCRGCGLEDLDGMLLDRMIRGSLLHLLPSAGLSSPTTNRSFRAQHLAAR